MKHIYLQRPDDRQNIVNYKKLFEQKSLEELVDAYNRQVRCGITGVHQQALYLMALKEEFKKRLKESPVYLTDYVLGLVGEIELVNDHIRIKEND